MLLKWIMVNKNIFNVILSTVTEAKNNGFETNVDGREITQDNTESLLKDIGSGRIDKRKFKKKYTILLMVWKRY